MYLPELWALELLPSRVAVRDARADDVHRRNGVVLLHPLTAKQTSLLQSLFTVTYTISFTYFLVEAVFVLATLRFDGRADRLCFLVVENRGLTLASQALIYVVFALTTPSFGCFVYFAGWPCVRGYFLFLVYWFRRSPWRDLTLLLYMVLFFTYNIRSREYPPVFSLTGLSIYLFFCTLDYIMVVIPPSRWCALAAKFAVVGSLLSLGSVKVLQLASPGRGTSCYPAKTQQSQTLFYQLVEVGFAFFQSAFLIMMMKIAKTKLLRIRTPVLDFSRDDCFHDSRASQGGRQGLLRE